MLGRENDEEAALAGEVDAFLRKGSGFIPALIQTIF
jgi:hypothetical protein